MNRPVTAPAAMIQSSATEMSWKKIGIAGLVFFFLWFEVVRQLGPEWSLNPQYGYGWSVPFLALFLLWKRWPQRPPVLAPASMALPSAIFILGALVLLPIRFVAEANPDWRLLSWALALCAVGVSLTFVFLNGGWPWLRYFSFPFLFFLVAVPWPAHAEQVVIQNLMRIVTAINVSVLNLFGVPALEHGNVIEITSGLIGIEEACSGVRSLQATLMISLFLGELYSFTIARRACLVIAGAALAFFCNLVRTAILVWVGVYRGPDAIESWHDPAGLTILLVCLFGLWGLSVWMKRFSADDSTSSAGATGSGVIPVRLPIVVALGAWLLITEAAVQYWYDSHQSPAAKLRWSVRWPTSESAYSTISIPAAAQGLLHYSDGGGATWSGNDGRTWTMYFFRWLPGQTAARFVKIHRPDICLPASGLTMIADHGIHLVETNGAALPVRSYRFDDHGQPLHVFYCYWDARSSYENLQTTGDEDWTARGRVRAAFRGQREIGAQMLEIVVRGYEDDAEASTELRRQLDQVIGTG